MAKISKAKKNMRRAFVAEDRLCVNCGVNIGCTGGHFVPPSMGEDGFFICDSGKEPWMRTGATEDDLARRTIGPTP